MRRAARRRSVPSPTQRRGTFGDGDIADDRCHAGRHDDGRVHHLLRGGDRGTGCRHDDVRRVTEPSTLRSSPGTTLTLDPDDLSAGVACQVTVVAARISDVDTNDPPDSPSSDHTFTFTTDSPPALSSSTPSASERGRGVGQHRLTFSQSVDVTPGALALTCSGSALLHADRLGHGRHPRPRRPASHHVALLGHCCRRRHHRRRGRRPARLTERSDRPRLHDRGRSPAVRRDRASPTVPRVSASTPTSPSPSPSR